VWVTIHKWVGLALGMAVLLHVALHWRWLVHKTRGYLEHVAGLGRVRSGLFRPSRR
jgi:hypothetical protein